MDRLQFAALRSSVRPPSEKEVTLIIERPDLATHLQLCAISTQRVQQIAFQGLEGLKLDYQIHHNGILVAEHEV